MSFDRRALPLISLILLVISNLVLGQTNSLIAQSSASHLSSKALAADARELIRDLGNRGVNFQESLIFDYSKPLSSDLDPGFGYGRYSFDFSATIDGKKLFHVPGGDGFVRLKHHINAFGETYDEAAQVYSNIDAGSRTVLYDIWYEQRLFSDRLRFKSGKIDANTEFAVVQNAGDFLNSSMGYSPTIVSFPTYPDPKLGISAFLKPLRNSSVGLGVFQTAEMGTLSIIEPGETWNVGPRELSGRISLGYWRLDGKAIDRFDGMQASGTQGFYSVIEQSAWKQSDRDRRVSMFLQMGWAEGRISPFTHHIGSGAILQAPFRRRSQDGIGAAVTWVRFSSYPQAGFELPSETIWETYYKAGLNKHVALVADFQYLRHPGGLLDHDDCPVFTPRLVITF